MRNNYYRSNSAAYSLERLIAKKKFRIFMVVFLVGIFVLTGLFMSGSLTHANASKEKRIISIEIKSGDTLWSIANEYADTDVYKDNNEFIEEVKSINHISDDSLKAGGYIIIPYYE